MADLEPTEQLVALLADIDAGNVHTSRADFGVHLTVPGEPDAVVSELAWAAEGADWAFEPKTSQVWELTALGREVMERGCAVTAIDAPPATYAVLHDVAIERAFQNGKWGEQNHPDGTGTNWVDQIRPAFGWSGPEAEHAAKLARSDCQRAARRNEATWLRILREEMAEAFAETDPVKLRAELIQIAAVACAWVEAIDRRGGEGRG